MTVGDSHIYRRIQRQKIVTLGVVSARVIGVVLGPNMSYAAPKAVKKASAKKTPPQPGTLGTKQMAGGDALIGQTYTYNMEEPWDLTIKRVEYGIGRYNVQVPATPPRPQARN